MKLKAGYKETDVGVIPEDWGISPLGDIFEISAGGDFDPAVSSDFRDATYAHPIYSNALTDAGLYGYTSVPAHRSGSITVTARGMIGSANFRKTPFTAIGRVIVMYPRGAHDGRYFATFVNERIDFAVESTGVPQLTAPQISKYQTAVPPIPEQRAIADALSDADALIASLEALIAKKRDLKQAAMQQLLTGKTRLPGFAREWEVKRLGELAILHKGQVVPGSQPENLFCHYSLPAFDNGRKPVLETGSEIGSNKFTVLSYSVLVSKLNPRIPRVWSLCSVPEHSVASTEFLVLLPKENVSIGFLSVLCGSTVFCEKMENAVTGTTGSHQRVAPKDAMRLEVDFPPDANEQTAIAEVLSDMGADLAALETQRDKAHALKQGMMQELLTGRIRLV